jgi:hypothetical protein
MGKKSQYKRNHHFAPKLYLKGFIEAESPFVWVYVKGKPYNPGHKSHHNPRRRPISRVGVERDHYAFRKSDGTVDFDTYEDELEKQEKPSNSVLEKLRRREMITEQEKMVFASYVYLMYKRVPKRKERFTKNWPRVFQSVSSGMTQWLRFEEAITDEADSARLARISELRSELGREMEYYRGHTPIDTEIPLKSLVTKSPLGIPGILSVMTWQFFIAPKGHGFLTSDNPVFYPGLDKPYAEVSFPISKDIALVISRYEIEQGFFVTTPEVVNEINRRTVSGAQYEVYHSSAEKWVLNLMTESREGYYLIYPYPGSLD